MKTAFFFATTINIIIQHIQEKLLKAQRQFFQVDKDNSGFIEEAELKELLIRSYREMGIDQIPSDEDVKTLLDAIDTNRDGRVSLREWEEMVIRIFQRLKFIQG